MTQQAIAGAGTREAPARRLLEGLLGVPFTDGNRVDVLRNGEEVFPALEAAVAAAQRSVDMLWFQWTRGEIAERMGRLLAERARDGVRVRVLLDAFGSRDVDRAALTTMRSAGCHVLFRRPVPTLRLSTANIRTHRRALVCDETVAFTGGLGIDRVWNGGGRRPGDWRDIGVRVEGPAVDGIRAGFTMAWAQGRARHGARLITPADRFPPLSAAGTVSVQVLRPAFQPGYNEAAVAITGLLHLARERIRIATPYARLPTWLVEDLAGTARRGVQVQLMVPGPHVDRRWVQLQADRNYQPLLDAGIELWRFQPSMMHAKAITVDGVVAMLGTTNLDVRSLAINEQIAVVVADEQVVGTLDRHFDEDLDVSRRVLPEEWRSRPGRRRLLERAADLAGRPLLGWGARGEIGTRPHGDG